MNAKEKYLFDLQGYLVVENALSKEQVEKLNRAIDEKQEAGESLFGFLEWEEQSFRDLINLESAKPYLETMLGRDFRLDHEYMIVHQKGAPQLGLHGGNTPYDPGQYYHVQNGNIFSGLTVFSYALTDIGEDDGGFCCIPGSHKSNFPVPNEYVEFDEIGPTVHIPQKAGDLLIFTEALTHGTFPWQADHERRSLLYKYSPLVVAWAKHDRPASLLEKLNKEQKDIMDPTYHPFLRSHSMY